MLKKYGERSREIKEMWRKKKMKKEGELKEKNEEWNEERTKREM